MNPNKTFKRFLKLFGFKMEDVLSTEDIISVVTSQVKAKELKLDDVLLVFEAEGIAKGDFKVFANRVAGKNNWDLNAMFGAKAPSLDEMAENISKADFQAFVQRVAKKNDWDLNAMFGLKPTPQTAAKTTAKTSAKNEQFQFIEDPATKLTYAVRNGNTLGVVISSPKVGRFVLALKDFAKDLDIYQTNTQVSLLASEAGKKWIVPSDEHFRAVAGNLRNINDLLGRLGGDVIYSRGAYLSSTSQANRPESWHVRLVLPL